MGSVGALMASRENLGLMGLLESLDPDTIVVASNASRNREMNEMTKPYCTCDRRRNDGWGRSANGDFVCPRCEKIAKRVWEVRQESCGSMGSSHTTPDTIVVEGKEATKGDEEMNEHSEHSEHGTGFDEDNCPKCGTSAVIPDVNDEDVNEPIQARIRTQRTTLGLSRKDVQVGTGLGASVVWRAEQDTGGYKIGDENITKILDFLEGYKTTYPDGKLGTFKNPKPTRIQSVANELTAAVEEWKGATWELRGVIDRAYALAEAKRTAASDAKRSTKAWDELLEILEPHITEK